MAREKAFWPAIRRDANRRIIMRTIKLHLEVEEFEPLNRLAHEIGVSPEDIVYAGLNVMMKNARNPEFRREMADSNDARKNSLPVWADHAHEVHAYECM